MLPWFGIGTLLVLLSRFEVIRYITSVPLRPAMRILFTFENPLPNEQADAEVFVATARHLAPLAAGASLHVPAAGDSGRAAAAALARMPAIRAWAPTRPAALRHFLCGLTLPLRSEFRAADLVYTRNLWVAWLAVRFGQRVVFDHYRPWPDQIPPLQPWIYRLLCHRRLVVHICHSEYTRRRYLDLGVPPSKLSCVHNGFDPARLAALIPIETAKAQIGIGKDTKTVVYTGRINHKKGLEIVLEAARRLPDLEFILVGASGDGPIQAAASGIANVRIVPWQPPEALAQYLYAADVLLIPPSRQPLAAFGSTVLPLKVFVYLAAGRPIVAGDMPDLREVLRHGENALLCRPDSPAALADAIRVIIRDTALAQRLAATALADSAQLTWARRADRIAAIIAARLPSTATEPGGWGRKQLRGWISESCRWVAHLVRHGSWVLPPRSAAAAPPLAPAEHD
ncbi:MAG: glycosyltransferase [Steroidobacteraceae bacterium]